MVTLRACRCHNGGIGDGGAVVAADSAREAGGNTDELERVSGLEHAEHDGDKDAEGTPAGSRCEGDKASRDEDNCGKKSGEGACVLHNAVYEVIASEETCGILKRVSEGEDEDRGNHCVEALRQSLHGVLEAHMTAGDHIDDDKHQRDETAPRQTNGGVGVAECSYEVHIVFGVCGEEAADVHKSEYGNYYQNDYGNDDIEDGSAVVDGLVDLVGADLTALAVLRLDLEL